MSKRGRERPEEGPRKVEEKDYFRYEFCRYNRVGKENGHLVDKGLGASPC